MTQRKQSKKLKRNIKLLILVGILAVVLLANLLVNRLANNPSDTTSTPSTEITLTNLNGKDITKVSYTRGEETVTLLWDNEKQVWLLEGDSAFPVRQSRARTMLSSVLKVISTQQITDSASLAEYGLDKPTCTVTVTAKDGTETMLSLGAQNSFNQNYYLLFNGDTSTVHTVASSLYDAFQYTLLEMAELDLPDSTISADRLEIQTSTATLSLFHSLKASEFFYTDAYEWFFTDESGVPHALDTALVKKLTDFVLAPAWETCVAYRPTAAQLAEFGLAEPAATISLLEEDKTEPSVTLLIGSYKGDSCYAMLKDSDRVYQISAENADLFRYASIDDLLPAEIVKPNWSEVEAITLVKGEENAILTFRYGTDGKVSGSLLNEETTDDNLTTALLSAIDALTATESEGITLPDSDPELTLLLTRGPGAFSELTLTLTQYDSETYLVTFHGQNRLIARSNAETLLEAANAFFAENE